MTFILKFPLLPDNSNNDPGPRLDKANPKPYGIMPRACFATYWPGMPYATYDVHADDIALSTFADSRPLGVRCGSYGYILQGKMDKQIDAFLEQNKKAGLIVGGKWQGEFEPCADVEAEAEYKSKKKPANWIAPLRGTAWANQIKYWLDSVEQATGVKPMIYTARPQWAYLLDSKGNAPTWTKDYRFWVKFYPFSQFIDANQVFPKSALPTGVFYEQVVFWQYHDKGRTNGYEWNDLNVVTDAGQLAYNEIVQPAPPPVEPPVEPALKQWQVASLAQTETKINIELERR